MEKFLLKHVLAVSFKKQTVVTISTKKVVKKNKNPISDFSFNRIKFIHNGSDILRNFNSTKLGKRKKYPKYYSETPETLHKLQFLPLTVTILLQAVLLTEARLYRLSKVMDSCK